MRSHAAPRRRAPAAAPPAAPLRCRPRRRRRAPPTPGGSALRRRGGRPAGAAAGAATGPLLARCPRHAPAVEGAAHAVGVAWRRWGYQEGRGAGADQAPKRCTARIDEAMRETPQPGGRQQSRAPWHVARRHAGRLQPGGRRAPALAHVVNQPLHRVPLLLIREGIQLPQLQAGRRQGCSHWEGQNQGYQHAVECAAAPPLQPSRPPARVPPATLPGRRQRRLLPTSSPPGGPAVGAARQGQTKGRPGASTWNPTGSASFPGTPMFVIGRRLRGTMSNKLPPHSAWHRVQGAGRGAVHGRRQRRSMPCCLAHPGGAVLEAQSCVLAIHVHEQLAQLAQHPDCRRPPGRRTVSTRITGSKPLTRSPRECSSSAGCPATPALAAAAADTDAPPARLPELGSGAHPRWGCR